MMGNESTLLEKEPKAMKASSQSRQAEDGESTEGLKDAELLDVKEKRVILNVDVNLFPLSKSLFKHLSDCLVMLQLGRWSHHDNKTYMEVDGLESESLCCIKELKNLRYLGLRGLSRLSKLPSAIKWLKNLEILDMRGCQNLVTVASKDISPLKHLIHIDLSDCYMLDHISQGITSLPDLQVLKGFVFGSGTLGNNGCRLQNLKKLKKVQKLTISITTDANVGRDDMAELQNLGNLRSLTITWDKIPSALEQATREQLLETWTSFWLPQGLEKLDLRCYPKEYLELKHPTYLKKLYLRGGEVQNIDIPKPACITTLRLRYLKKLNMKWEDIISISKEIKYVEIRVKNEKFLEHLDLDEKYKEVLEKEIEEERKLLKGMEIPDSVLDDNGIWMKDDKEELN